MTYEEMTALLEPLIREAENKGLWLRCHYQGFWVSPTELRESLAKGRLGFSPENWDLLPPTKRLEQLEKEQGEAGDAVERFKRKMAAP